MSCAGPVDLDGTRLACAVSAPGHTVGWKLRDHTVHLDRIGAPSTGVA